MNEYEARLDEYVQTIGRKVDAMLAAEHDGRTKDATALAAEVRQLTNEAYDALFTGSFADGVSRTEVTA